MSMFEKYSMSHRQIMCPQTFPIIIQNNRVLTLCNYGGGRSPEAAKILTEEFNINSVFYDCGIGGIAMLDPTCRRNTISKLKQFPNTLVFLYELERQKFRYYLKDLGILDKNIFTSAQTLVTQIRSKQFTFK